MAVPGRGPPKPETGKSLEDHRPAADPRSAVIFDVGRSTSWPRRRCDSACWTPPHEIQGGGTPVSARFDVRSGRRRYRVSDERVPDLKGIARVGSSRPGSIKAGNWKILGRPPTCGRPAARGNFRRRQILFPRPFEASCESSDTNPRNLGGRDACGGMGSRRLKSAAGALTRKWASDPLPALGSVARVEGSSIYLPAMGHDGQFASIIIRFGTPRGSKFSIPFSRRRRGAQGVERPGGGWGWALQR